MNTFAQLKKDSPFYDYFPDGRAPIHNWLVAEQGVMQGDNGDRPQDFYRVDLSKLSDEQFARICHAVAHQCKGVPEVVSREFRMLGFIPLRGIHVASTSSDSLAFL